MTKTTSQIAVRLKTDELANIDAFREVMASQLLGDLPGIEFTRADAIRLLINEGLRARGMLPQGDMAQAIAADLRKEMKTSAIVKHLGCKPSDVEWVANKIMAGGEHLPGRSMPK